MSATNHEHEMTDIRSNSDFDSTSGSEMDEETGLTKRERQQRRRQGGQLDMGVRPGRAASGAREEESDPSLQKHQITVSKQEAKIADRDVIQKLLINSVLILLWYFFSLAISLVRSIST
jgi:solute carrier family 35, member C2